MIEELVENGLSLKDLQKVKLCPFNKMFKYQLYQWVSTIQALKAVIGKQNYNK